MPGPYAVRIRTPDGWQDIAAAGVNGKDGLNAPPALVSGLPGSPTNGQECYFLADATNGLIWHLRYRAFQADGTTPNPSIYKWEFIGGTPLRLATIVTPSIATTTYTLFPGSAMTIPLAGDYLCDWGGSVNATAGQGAYLTPAGAGLAASDASPIFAQNGVGGTADPASRRAPFTFPTAGGSVGLYGKVGSGSFLLYYPWLVLQPVRVG